MQPKTMKIAILLTAVLAVFFAFAASAFDVTGLAELANVLALGGLGAAAMTFGAGRLQADNELLDATNFGSGSGTTTGGGIDLEVGPKSDFVAGAELLIESPLLTVAELLATATITYDVYHDTASDFATEVLLQDNAMVVTSPAGSGAAAQTARVAIPTNVKRYVRIKAVTADASDRTAKQMKLSVRT